MKKEEFKIKVKETDGDLDFNEDLELLFQELDRHWDFAIAEASKNKDN